MPTCVLRYCKNRSGKFTEGEGVTFHRFPHRFDLNRAVWIKLVQDERREECWLPSDYTRVCSNHFKEADMYTTKNGRRFLKKSAVPCIRQHKDTIPIEYDEQEQSTAASSYSISKRQVHNEKNIEDTSDSDTINPTTETVDKYEAYGKYIATKLSQLEKQQRMFVERIIEETIYEGQMGNLNVNSKLVVDTERDILRQSHDDKVMRLVDQVVNLEEDVSGIKYEIDAEEPNYLSEDDSHRTERYLDIDKNVLGSGYNLIATKTIRSEELAEVSRPLPLHEDIPIKVEIVTEEDANILVESEISDHPIEDIPIKKEVVAEDENLPRESRTEFVINKQHSSIEVVSYRSSNSKRKRSHEEGEATIHLEVARR